MLLRCRKLLCVLGFAAAVALGGPPLGAQDAKKEGPKPADAPAPAAAPAPAPAAPAVVAKKAYDPARRVPDFFGQVGLTLEQREAIYKVRSRHLQRLDELEKQVAQVRAEMLDECEKVLSDVQKQVLASRRRDALEKRKERTRLAAEKKARARTAEAKPAG